MAGQEGSAHHGGRIFWRWPLPPLREMSRRTWTVLAMVTLAVLGAVTSCHGAKTEQETISIGQTLVGGQLLAVSETHRLDVENSAAAKLQARESAVHREGEIYESKAADERLKGQNEDAAWNTMRAQEEYAAERTLKLFSDRFAATWRSADEAKRQIISTLAEAGFGTFFRSAAVEGQISAPTDSEQRWGASNIDLSHLWTQAQAKLDGYHQGVRNSALAVAVFVLALAFLTFSDACVTTRWRTATWHLFVTGLVTGAIAVAIVLCRVDFEIWRSLLGALIVTLAVWFGLHLVLAYAERRGWVHFENVGSSVHPEEIVYERIGMRLPALGHHDGHWFGTVTIVLVASAVFLSAAVGWGYVVASTHADAEAVEARNSAAEMVNRKGLFASRQGELLWEVATAAEQRMRLAFMNQQSLLSEGSSKLLRYAGQWQHQRELRSEAPSMSGTIGIALPIDYKNFSTDSDPRFPNRLLWQLPRVPLTASPPKDEAERASRKRDEHSQRIHNAYEALALWALETSESSAWRKIATQLIAVLTIFAIVLYFLGQGLAMGPTRSGFALLIAGILFGSYGISSGLVAAYPMIRLTGFAEPAREKIDALLSDKHCPAVYSEFFEESEPARKLAAYYYGVGKVLFDDRSNREDVELSKHYFECAATLQRDFAQVQIELSSVNDELGSLDAAEPFMSLPVRQQVQGEVDLERVQSLLQESRLDLSSSQRNSLVFDGALKALIEGNYDALELIERLAQKVLRKIRTDGVLVGRNTEPSLQSNLGFVQLARGEFQSGLDAYKAASRASSNNFFKMSLFTDLETLQFLRCKDATRAMAVKFDCAGLDRTIVEVRRAVLAKQNDEPRRRTESALPKQLAVSASGNSLIAALEGFDAATDDLFLIWSQLESSWNSWRTLQRISWPVESPRKDAATGQSQPLRVEQFLSEYAGMDKCLPQAEFRADLYSHGIRVATGKVTRSAPAMQTARFHELNVRLCIPPGWSAVPAGGLDFPKRNDFGFVRGIKDGAGKFAAFVVSFYIPRQSDGLSSKCLVARNAVDCAVKALANEHLIQGTEPLVEFRDMSAPLDTRALVYLYAFTEDGGAHIILIRADAATEAQIRDIVGSAQLVYGEHETKTSQKQ
jgi:hypothetical protein